MLSSPLKVIVMPMRWRLGSTQLARVAAGVIITITAACMAPTMGGDRHEGSLSSEPPAPSQSTQRRSPADASVAPPSSDTVEWIQALIPSRAASLRNEWSPELEAEFWQRATPAIDYYLKQRYGNTHGENEKRSYPIALFHVLAGDRQNALNFLQSDDAEASDHRHTEGIDYYYAFTLKGQMRKYFLLESLLDPDYHQRMWRGAQAWTAEDPNGRPHPIYGTGSGGSGWGPDARGGWVDGRNTDNLRAMREIAVYLMAEETGNERVRVQYKGKIQDFVRSLYTIGMGEWDSENYHDHTLTAYLNLYDFADDLEVQQLAKSTLDWLAAAGAVKYYRGGFGGPSKRDYGEANVVFGSAAARLLWHYFGDATVPNPEPQRDAVHVLTSTYRPPEAVVALARKQFDRPVELLSTKPIYEHWLPGKSDRPAYWETTFWGHTYQMGSVVSSFADGDVSPFKLMADSDERGVDYFVANTGGGFVRPGKHDGDQIGQYRNLLIWLRPADERPFFFQLPQTAEADIDGDIWFFQFDKTWLAVYPINLSGYDPVEIPDDELANHYAMEQTLKAMPRGNTYAGFALEVGEAETHGSYADFKADIRLRSRLDIGAIAQGTAQLNSSTDTHLQLTYNPDDNRPIVIRHGVEHDLLSHLALYQPTEGDAPITLGWKEGTLRVEAGGHVFETRASE